MYFLPYAPLLWRNLIPACAVTSVNSTGANLSGSGGSVEADGDGEAAASGAAVALTLAGVADAGGCVVEEGEWQATANKETANRTDKAEREMITLIVLLAIKI